MSLKSSPSHPEAARIVPPSATIRASVIAYKAPLRLLPPSPDGFEAKASPHSHALPASAVVAWG